MGIVDDGEERLGSVGMREKTQRRDIGGEAVAGDGRRKSEYRGQRFGLRLRQPRDPVAERSEQLAEAGERQLGLPLDTATAQDARIGRQRHGVVEEGGLADAGLTRENQRAALA